MGEPMPVEVVAARSELRRRRLMQALTTPELDAVMELLRLEIARGLTVSERRLRHVLERRARLRLRLGLVAGPRGFDVAGMRVELAFHPDPRDCWECVERRYRCWCRALAVDDPAAVRAGRAGVERRAWELHRLLVDDEQWRRAMERADRRVAAALVPVPVATVVGVLPEPEGADSVGESAEELPAADGAAETESATSGVRMVPGAAAFVLRSRRSEAERSIAAEIMEAEF